MVLDAQNSAKANGGGGGGQREMDAFDMAEEPKPSAAAVFELE
jgi:hypothetical protein